MTILVVDNSTKICNEIAEAVRASGLGDVDCVASFGEALTRLGQAERRGGESEAASPSLGLVLLDIDIHDMDVVVACRILSSTPHLANTPVVLLCERVESPALEEALEAGAFDFITKPVRPAEVRARVRAALRLKRAQEERREKEHELVETTTELQISNQRYVATNRELKRRSDKDALTGVSNRRRFDELIRLEVLAATRRSTPLTLLMLDVDHFKLYNDSYGHQAGDECLKTVAQAVARTLQRETDTVARYGGEEFAVILPETDAEGARVCARRICETVAALKIPHKRSAASPFVTVSVGGFAAVPPPRAAPANVIKAADAQLYLAKEQGRNRALVTDDLRREAEKQKTS